MLLFAPLFWAGNRPLPLLFLELVSLFLLLVFIIKKDNRQRLTKPLAVTVASIMFLPLLYLIPLPVVFLESLGVYELYFKALDFADHSPNWRTLTLYPNTTESSYYTLLVPVAVFLTALSISQTQLQKLIYIGLGVAVFQAILGLMQYAHGPESWLRLGNDHYLYSAVGTYPNRNHLAGLLEMLLPIALGLIAASVAVGQRGIKKGVKRHFSEKKWMNSTVWYAALVLVLLIGLIYTRSRMGMAMGMLAVFCALFAFAQQLGRRHVLGLIGSITVVSVGLATLIGLLPLLRRFTQQDVLADVRWDIFERSLQAVEYYLPFGSGPGTFPHVYPQFQSTDLGTMFVNHAHNDYLEWLVEGGLFAAILIVIFLVLYLVRWRQVWQGGEWSVFRFCQVGSGIGVLLILLHSFVDFNLRIPANMVFFAFITAVFFYNEEKIQTSQPKKQKQSSLASSRQTNALPDTVRSKASERKKVVNPFAK